jgi:hypothetical protein
MATGERSGDHDACEAAMTRPERFTAWITKYALTQGILKMQVADCFDTSPGMVTKVNGPVAFYHGDDWHRSHEAAIEKAKAMQTSKLDSVDKQRERIAALRFER